jgi:SulP family sulfate permease
MRQFFPILDWLPNYRREYLKPDITAGMVVAVLLIPQAMAYAILAGLPPIMGLYAAFVPLLIYPIFGTSRVLVPGPVALDSILVAAGLGMLAAPGSEHYIQLALVLAFTIGLIQIITGLARLGFIVEFLANPVITGFTSAAAVIIAFSQLRHLVGIPIPGSQRIDTLLAYFFDHIGEFHFPTFLIGISCMVFLLLQKRYRPRWPGSLIVVVVSTLAVWYWNLADLGVNIVGKVPQGLPKFQPPDISWPIIHDLLPLALTLAFVGFMETFMVARRFSAKKSYEVVADQELLSLGASNLAVSFFSGYPSSVSFSRTAVNAENGAQTSLSLIASAMVIAVTLLFLTPLFYYMPKAMFAAIIIMAVIGLIDIKEAKRLYRVRKSDFFVLVFAFCATLLLGIQQGVILSVIASVVMILRRITRPKVIFLGEIPQTRFFRNIERIPEAREISGLIIVRIDASLYFANISYFKDKLYEAIQRRSDEPIKAVIIDAAPINDIDSTAESVLSEMVDELAADGIRLYFTNVKGYLRDAMKRSGLYEKIGEAHFFLSKYDAVQYFRKQMTQPVDIIEPQKR